jgi:hypothetical protein
VAALSLVIWVLVERFPTLMKSKPTPKYWIRVLAWKTCGAKSNGKRLDIIDKHTSWVLGFMVGWGLTPNTNQKPQNPTHLDMKLVKSK